MRVVGSGERLLVLSGAALIFAAAGMFALNAVRADCNGGGGTTGWNCTTPGFGGGCPPGSEPYLGQCCYPYSPILLDLEGDGFDLTDAYNGVSFDIGRDGYPDQVAWTSPGSDDSWLALDRNGNSLIDDGSELFGNVTEQPPTLEPNGFLALQVFDQPDAGGNQDGRIDHRDAVFLELRLWRDENHNGISEPGELQALPEANVEAIELDYREARRKDRHGNLFRYRAKASPPGVGVGRWAWDVFLLANPPPSEPSPSSAGQKQR